MHEEITHPCVQHKLALIRDVDTGHKKFRELATEITMFVCYEALKSLSVNEVDVQTPVAPAKCHKIAEEIVVVPICAPASVCSMEFFLWCHRHGSGLLVCIATKKPKNP